MAEIGADELLSMEQAYKAMVVFLEHYYELTASDDVGALLGSMSLLADGSSADPAMWLDWREAVRKAL